MVFNGNAVSKTTGKWLFWIAALAFVAGFILSIVSWLRLCTGVCSENHNWQVFGMPFEIFGASFFVILVAMLYFSPKYPDLTFYMGLMLAGALGGELRLIQIQKQIIGAWCPVCLSIAACVAGSGPGHSVARYAR